ncbi:hypothetical protein IF2G_00505 [Cordyceps javanica]|nr:hypothetical protein IF2G_00505 [Cordyceps javanica]
MERRTLAVWDRDTNVSKKECGAVVAAERVGWYPTRRRWAVRRIASTPAQTSCARRRGCKTDAVHLAAQVGQARRQEIESTAIRTRDGNELDARDARRGGRPTRAGYLLIATRLVVGSRGGYGRWVVKGGYTRFARLTLSGARSIGRRLGSRKRIREGGGSGGGCGGGAADGGSGGWWKVADEAAAERYEVGAVLLVKADARVMGDDNQKGNDNDNEAALCGGGGGGGAGGGASWPLLGDEARRRPGEGAAKARDCRLILRTSTCGGLQSASSRVLRHLKQSVGKLDGKVPLLPGRTVPLAQSEPAGEGRGQGARVGRREGRDGGGGGGQGMRIRNSTMRRVEKEN